MGLVVLWCGGSSLTRDWTRVPCIGRYILNHWTTRGVPRILNQCQLSSVKWYLIMVKVCSSLTTSDHLTFYKTSISGTLHFFQSWLGFTYADLLRVLCTLFLHAPPPTIGLLCTSPALPQGVLYFKPYPFLQNKLRSRPTFPTKLALVNISEFRSLHLNTESWWASQPVAKVQMGARCLAVY